jgi:predicted homoserine dehydrogenase-like protein
LAQSIYSIALENKATGKTNNYNADVASIAKKDLKIGEKLDGEGGFCARGKLINSNISKEKKILPLGLTDGAILRRNVKKNQILTFEDVQIDLPEEIIKSREYQYKLI